MVGARKAVATAAVFQSVPVKTDQDELDFKGSFLRRDHTCAQSQATGRYLEQ